MATKRSEPESSKRRKRGVIAAVARIATAPVRLFIRSVFFFAGADEIKAQVDERVQRIRRMSDEHPRDSASNSGRNRADQRLAAMGQVERDALVSNHVSVQRLCCGALWTAILSIGYGIATHQVFSALAAASWGVFMFLLSGKRVWAVHMLRSGHVVPFMTWLRKNVDRPFWPLSRSE
ncbi:hypothetical protein [Burkholderia cepacia]|uniref:Uncharacterized protein n=2 Tax=Burkholderia cepacia TaxID=292 RepID=A0AAX2RR31_BURCE|nr:hypothetical protein [Burkholderia cepacia]TET01652.1 hypothetical protein E3D36_16590 [Burkholderia cepacia]TEU47510.1 hypothetical protein E3D37_16020 [Burkholderia cepacia]TEU53537.1 hypothetical protein E3D38_12410 [Burkholderia cepacia]TEV02143.1 hypothetical protein E3D40_13340 [Burkholderia cepacia]TEV07954.1 hypothetical protein E3D44_19340 [Burkholderia cepacia]